MGIGDKRTRTLNTSDCGTACAGRSGGSGGASACAAASGPPPCGAAALLLGATALPPAGGPGALLEGWLASGWG